MNSLSNDFPTLTEAPVLLKAGTDGTAGQDGKYVLFGDWPQSLKKDDVTIDEIKTYKVNEWDCFKGSDGAFYVKAVAKPYIIKIEAAFYNGNTIIEDNEYYFKLESIKWRILDNNYGGGKLLLSEKALCGCCFDHHIKCDFNKFTARPKYKDIIRTINGKPVYGNNYEYSTIRAYLNGLNGSSYDVADFSNKGFINKAFTKKAIEIINTVNVDNSSASTTDMENSFHPLDEYACNNTKDKIFLLSEREATNKSYGFDSCAVGVDGAEAPELTQENKTKTSSRCIQYTDYSLATGVYTFATKYYKNTCCWWLRSPASDIVVSARSVHFGGSVDEFSMNCINNDDVAVVPAISVSF